MITKRYHLACFVSMIVLMLVCVPLVAYASCGGASVHNELFWYAIMSGFLCDIIAVHPLVSAIYLKKMVPKEKHSNMARIFRYVIMSMCVINIVLTGWALLGSAYNYPSSDLMTVLIPLYINAAVMVCAAVNVYKARKASNHLAGELPEDLWGDPEIQTRVKNLIDVHYAYRFGLELIGLIAVIVFLVTVNFFECMMELEYFGIFLLISIPAIIIIGITLVFIPKHIEQKLLDALKSLSEKSRDVS